MIENIVSFRLPLSDDFSGVVTLNVSVTQKLPIHKNQDQTSSSREELDDQNDKNDELESGSKREGLRMGVVVKVV